MFSTIGIDKVSTPKTKKELIELLKNRVPGPLNKKGDLILNPPNLKYL